MQSYVVGSGIGRKLKKLFGIQTKSSREIEEDLTVALENDEELRSVLRELRTRYNKQKALQLKKRPTAKRHAPQVKQ